MTWNEASQHYSVLYIRYVRLLRKLEECYDQIVHPQKRRDIRVTLDCAMARVSQLREKLFTFGLGGFQTDFPNLDAYLLDLKLAPHEIEVPIPRSVARQTGRGREDGSRQ